VPYKSRTDEGLAAEVRFKRRLHLYRPLPCFTILYGTRIPPMLNLVGTVAAGRAGCHGYNLCKLIEARSAGAPDLAVIYIETTSSAMGVEHA